MATYFTTSYYDGFTDGVDAFTEVVSPGITISENNNSLNFTVGVGTLANTTTGPIAYTAIPEGNTLHITTKMTRTWCYSGQYAGLALYNDANNIYYFEVAVGSTPYWDYYASARKWVGGVTTGLLSETDTNVWIPQNDGSTAVGAVVNQTVYLKVSYDTSTKGALYYTSANGTTWTQRLSTTLEFTPLYMGLAGRAASGGITASFAYFDVQSEIIVPPCTLSDIDTNFVSNYYNCLPNQHADTADHRVYHVPFGFGPRSFNLRLRDTPLSCSVGIQTALDSSFDYTKTQRKKDDEEQEKELEKSKETENDKIISKALKQRQKKENK